ncbi:MAG: hypothetical protein EAX89_08805 [Candidatus Lokiarchaeota archaeon]|nr:hypothetical protein [Candidatus Lokiarchaeota archaeon]
MNKKNKKLGFILSTIIVSIVFANFFLFIESFHMDENHILIQKFDDKLNRINAADNGKPSLNYSAFYQNTTSVYKLFESIEFNVNTASFLYANHTKMKIDYSDSSSENLDMQYVSGTHNFTYTYTPRYNAPLGFHNISFLIYNTSNVLLSSDLPITNFTIKTNYLMVFNSSEYYKDNYLYAELMVSDEPQPYNFNWNITVVDNENETIAANLFHVSNNVQQFSFKIDERFEFSNKIYYVKLNLSDPSYNLKVPAYFPFTVLNSDPEIEISTIEFSSTTIKRAEDCILTLNVSDHDYATVPENLTVSIIIKDSFGFSQSAIILDNNDDWSFTTTFKIAANKPIGIYQVTIEVEDQYGGSDSYTSSITVQNNPPEIYSYTINGFSMEESIEVDYGDDIIFTFNVSDVENSITYVSVHLINEENEWYNLSKAYRQNMEFIIRTEELLTGVWYVYISITDADGETTYLTSDFGLGPQELRIIPDLLTPILLWVGFVIGVIIGLLGGIGILYRKFKSKYEEGKEISTKKLTSVIKPKKQKKEAIEKVTELEEAEISDSEKSEDSNRLNQRRIKRKLK